MKQQRQGGVQYLDIILYYIFLSNFVNYQLSQKEPSPPLRFNLPPRSWLNWALPLSRPGVQRNLLLTRKRGSPQQSLSHILKYALNQLSYVFLILLYIFRFYPSIRFDQNVCGALEHYCFFFGFLRFFFWDSVIFFLSSVHRFTATDYDRVGLECDVAVQAYIQTCMRLVGIRK